MRRIHSFLLGFVAVIAFTISSAHATAPLITIDSAVVTQVRSVDEGFKTFSTAASGFPVNMALNTVGDSFMFDAFLLFTDENKVNQEEPNPTGDLTPFLIAADVTFSSPVSTTLTFTGVTFGQEDFTGVPGVDPVTGNVVNQTLLLAWAQTATDEQIALAGGQGVVQWDGPQIIDIGGGEQLTVTLKDGVYNRAVNFPALLGLRGFGGPGVANAGTVQGNVELAIPEPGSAILLLLGVAGLVVRRKR